MLPITTIRVENAEFDTQRLKAMEEGKPLPVGTDYQLGEKYDQYNVRQHVLHRDGYQCTNCGAPKKGSESHKLHVHHLETRKTGGNRPDNLITLCDVCHKLYHEGKITLKKTKPKSFRDAAFMGIMRKTLTNQLKELYPNIKVCETYGYITKYNRDKYHIEKSHINDGYTIAKNFKAIRSDDHYILEFKRRHNRKIHKNTINKGGTRKLNAQFHIVNGYRLFDRVKYQNKYYFVFGRRNSGYFDIRDLNGNKVNKGSINAKLLKIVDFAKTTLIERRKGAPPMTKVTGFRA